MEYPIKINVRINKKQYDRIRESGVSKSEYVRDAIDFFNTDLKKDIELSKLNVINEIQQSFDMEQERFDEYVKQEKIREEYVQNTLKEEYDKCNLKLEKIAEEESKYSDVNIVKPRKVTSEEVILKVLPTIQGIYRSETGITYDKLRVLAFRINISPEILMHWIDQNEKLVQGDDYQERPRLKHENDTLKNFDK